MSPRRTRAELEELAEVARMMRAGELPHTVALEALSEEGAHAARRPYAARGGDAEDEALHEQRYASALRLLTAYTAQERRELLAGNPDLDPHTLEALAETLEEHRSDLEEATSAAKVTAVLATVRVLRDLKTAAAKNPTPSTLAPTSRCCA
jgi:hypothetical protein